MSNLDPQLYDDNAINYDVKNTNIINDVSTAIGVSPGAVAASISREITRADDEMAPAALLHKLAVFDDIRVFPEW